MKSLQPRKFSDPKRPNLKYVVKWSENGRRKARFFKTKMAAELFISERSAREAKVGKEKAKLFTDALRDEALLAASRLKPFGASITDAVNHYLKHIEALRVAQPVPDAIANFLVDKRNEGRSKRYLDDLACRLAVFEEAFEDRTTVDVSEAEVMAVIDRKKVSATTRANYLRVWKVFVNHNPNKLQRDRDKGPVQIFTPEHLRILLDHAAATHPEILAFIAIGAFAGIRSQEIERLRWQDVRFDSGAITLEAQITKGARRRVVDMEPCLDAWLRSVRRPSGPIVSRGFQTSTRFKAFKKRVADAPFGVAWVHNGLRHSFASYHVAKYQDAARTALALGHSGSTQMLFTHYREVASRDAAERWFSTMPLSDAQAAVNFNGRAAV